MIAAIDLAKAKGDTLGGVFEVVALGCPVGLGSYVQWDRRLDGRLAQAFCSIQAIKGAELGLGFETARRPGSQVHDEILYDAEAGFRRTSNNAGGLEGGVTNGQPVVVRAAMKPLSTLRTPLRSVDVATKEPVEAVVERSDVCAVPAAGIVGEAMMAIVLAQAFLEKFGGDSLEEIRRNYDAYMESLKHW
jgi:chorismate synthase